MSTKVPLGSNLILKEAEAREVEFNEWRELASDYIEGTLSPRKNTEIHEFLASSSAARADEAALRGLARQLGTLPEVDPPLFFADNIFSRLQREQQEAHQRSWRGWLPNLGRLAAGSLVTGGVLAALAWGFFFPKESRNLAAGAIGVPQGKVASDVARALPKLIVARPILQGDGTDNPTLDFRLSLEGADHGTVIARVPGGRASGLFFNRDSREAKILRLPLAPGDKVATVELTWTGDGVKGEKWVLVPLASAPSATLRRSFSQGELPLVQAVAAVAGVYGQSIILEDLPSREQRVRLDAENETLEELLRRHLVPLGLRVVLSEGRLTLSPQR